MNNLMSFVVNTGTPEGDQYEIARYQQYYQAYGVALAAQPQPQGGFLLTTYQSQPAGSSQEAHAPQQYGNAAQPEPAAPQQYGLATQAGYGAPQQYGAPAAQGTPQPFGVGTQAGYGTPQHYSAAPQAAHAGPQAPAAAAAPAPAAYASPAQPTAPAPAGYGNPPQQAPAYGAPQQAPAYGAPQQAPAYGAPQQAPAYGAPPPQQHYGAPPQAHPYGNGFGSESAAAAAAPGSPWGMPAPAPSRGGGLGSRLGNFSLMQKLKFAGSAVVVLGLAGWSFFLFRQAQSNIVLFENSLDVPGVLSVAGKAYGSIAPRQALRLELDSGSHEVSFTGNGTKLDGGTLNVPKGNGTIGYRAVYNLGGKPGIAVVTKYYGGSFEDRVVPVAEGTRVVEVPNAQTLDRIDDGFPDSVTVPKHQTFATLVRVCHVDEAKGTVGCPGW